LLPLTLHLLGRCSHPLALAAGPEHFQPVAAPLDPSERTDTVAQRLDTRPIFRIIPVAAQQHANSPHTMRLLRARHARQERRHRRAANERHERAAVHSITSSASNCSELGTARPRAAAVLRLMTSSYLSGS